MGGQNPSARFFWGGTERVEDETADPFGMIAHGLESGPSWIAMITIAVSVVQWPTHRLPTDRGSLLVLRVSGADTST